MTLLLSSSVSVVGFITFVGDSSRGILFSLLWLLCHQLSGSLIELGYLVATFSLGRLVVTTPLGYFCDIYHHKLALIVANSILCIGALLWANVSSFGTIKMLYVAQFLMGCGSGSLGVTRSFIVEQVSPKERTHCLAFMTALQYAGFTISTIAGSTLGAIGSYFGNYWKFALPAYSIFLLSFVCVLLLVTVFDDTRGPDYNSVHSDDSLIASNNISAEDSKGQQTTDVEMALANHADVDSPFSGEQGKINEVFSFESVADTVDRSCRPCNEKASLDCRTVCISVGRNICESPGGISNFNHVDDCNGHKDISGSVAATDDARYSDSCCEDTGTNTDIKSRNDLRDARLVLVALALLNVSTKGSISVYETVGLPVGMTDYAMTSASVGFLITVSGIIGFLQLLFFKRLWARYFSDIQLMVGGIAVMIVAQLAIYSYTPYHPVTNSNDSGSSSSNVNNAYNHAYVHGHGGSGTPQFWRFLFCIVAVYGFGYPIASTAVLGAFSKVQKQGRQAAMLSWFATAGSASRILLPIVVGYTKKLNRNGPYGVVLLLLSASSVGITLFRRKIRYHTGDDEDPLHQKLPFACDEVALTVFFVLLFIFSFVTMIWPIDASWITNVI